jgi:hypothetical protein
MKAKSDLYYAALGGADVGQHHHVSTAKIYWDFLIFYILVNNDNILLQQKTIN